MYNVVNSESILNAIRSALNEDVELEYDEDGLVSSEWAYNKADEIAKALYAE